MKKMTLKSGSGAPQADTGSAGGLRTGTSTSALPLRANPTLTHNSLDAFRKLRRGILEPIPPKETADGARPHADDGCDDVDASVRQRATAVASSSPSPPTPSPPLDPAVARSDADAARAGSAPSRPDTRASNATTTASKRSASRKRAKDQDDRGVRFQSFLDEVPVEACLEYLTRPHTSWDSAVNTIRQRLDRIEELNAAVRSRSFASSRRASFASLDSLNTTTRSVASAPAGFPRAASNSSRTKTGALRRQGRLGTGGTASTCRSTSATPPPAAPDLTIMGESTTVDVLGLTATSNVTTATAVTTTASVDRTRTRSNDGRTSTVGRAGPTGAAHAPRGGQLARGSAVPRQATQKTGSAPSAPFGSFSPSVAARGETRPAKVPKVPLQAKQKPPNTKTSAVPSTGLDLCIGPSR